MTIRADLVDAWALATPGPSWGYMNLPDDLSPVIARGEGCRVWDVDGRSYVDHLLSSGPMVLGHAHPAVVEAVSRQIRDGSSYFSLNVPALRLAEEILSAAACGDTLHFQTTGSEATAGALRIARAATGRAKVIKFEGGFHGSHELALLSNDAVAGRPAPLINPSSAGGSPGYSQDVLIATYNDIASVQARVDEHPGEVAAVIIEPVQRAILPQPGFLDALRALTRKEGILLIYDEIVTGFRLAWGGAQELFGVIPDLACYGKIIGGGFAISAVVGPRDLMKLADPRRRDAGESYCFLSGTLTGNPVSATAGLATLQVLKESGTYERLKAQTRLLAGGLRDLAQRKGLSVLVSDICGMVQVYFTERNDIQNARDLLDTDKKAAVTFGRHLVGNGVLNTPGGKLYVSTAHGKEDIEETLRAADKAFDKIQKYD